MGNPKKEIQSLRNKYDEFYEIRKAGKEDVPMIMEFIRNYWKKDHILGNYPKFFEYEFGDEQDFNMILAIDKESGKMVGHIGIIPYSKEDISGAMIRVLDDLPIPMLGVELIRRRKILYGYRKLVAVGLNPRTIVPLLKHIFHRKVGIMEHGYLLGDVSEYRIALIQQKPLPKRMPEPAFYREISSISEYALIMNPEQRWDKLPFKSISYLDKRYFHHPIYGYRKFLLQTGSENALVIAREVEQNGSKIFRIVDFVGNIQKLTYVFDFASEVLSKERFEYIDFMVGGLEEGFLAKCGFHVLQKGDVNIIPNYFEPFVQENIEVWYEASEDLVVFRAEGDGDRPSVMPAEMELP